MPIPIAYEYPLLILGMPWEAWGFMLPFGIVLLGMMIEFQAAENKRRDEARDAPEPSEGGNTPGTGEQCAGGDTNGHYSPITGTFGIHPASKWGW